MKKQNVEKPNSYIELANKETDHCYWQQINETEHQNHRMVWIFAAQTLLFAALSLKYLDKVDAEHLGPLLFCIIMMTGTGISISSVYSMLVGEFAIGNILDEWSEYHNRGKLHEKEHLVMVVPPAVLKSKLSFLSLYSCAPKILCTAWLTIFLVFLSHYHVVELGTATILSTMVCFIFVFIAISIVVYFYSNTKRNQIDNERQKEYIEKNRIDNERLNANIKKLECQMDELNTLTKCQEEQLGKRTMMLKGAVSLLSILAIYELLRQIRRNS